jgi:hypothetical protein
MVKKLTVLEQPFDNLLWSCLSRPTSIIPPVTYNSSSSSPLTAKPKV